MKVTNKMKLPQAFVNAVSLERHNAAGHYSATTLNKGTKEIVLTNRHFEEIEIDVSDEVWKIWGTVVHELFEKQKDNNFHEEKLSVDVSESTVTGQIDSYDLENEVVYDWKTASVWKVQFADFADWKKQGLTYAWLLKKNGLGIKKIRFIALLKDHSKSKARYDSQYPQSPVYVYEFNVTDQELIDHENWIVNKVKSLEMADVLEDDFIPYCSEEERWATPDKWAVMKEGRKTALKLHDNEADAKAQAEALGKAHFVEYRQGESRKCEDYCNVKQWCSFYKQTHGGEQ